MQENSQYTQTVSIHEQSEESEQLKQLSSLLSLLSSSSSSCDPVDESAANCESLISSE